MTERFGRLPQLGRAVFFVALLSVGAPPLVSAQTQATEADPGAPAPDGQTVAAATGAQEPSKSNLPARPAPNLNPRVRPITQQQRIQWFIKSTIGFQGLAAGAVSAGLGTAVDKPPEFGRTWQGFGKSYGLRLTGIATSNLTEAEVGSFWGEDPRYFRVPNRPFGSRVSHVVRMTFEAPRANGEIEPAYARFVGIVGNNFLSNLWRPPSEATTEQAEFRIGLGLLGRMGSNTFHEFWPDVRQWLRRKR